MEDTKIQWADHTFNPWRGCTKVASGCANCYAERQSKRNTKTLGIWGDNGTRVVASEEMWKQPEKWNRDLDAFRCPECGYTLIDAAGNLDHELCLGTIPIPRVFCASLADVFEDWEGPMVDHNGAILNAGPNGDGTWDKDRWWICDHTDSPRVTMQNVRDRLFMVQSLTPNLDWLVLTKRPENIPKMLPSHARKENLWLGYSIAEQKDTDKIEELLKSRHRAEVCFLSCEPLVGPVNLRLDRWAIDWVIIGGESGPHARECRLSWINDIIEQCEAADVPVFVKQMGQNFNDDTVHPDYAHEAWQWGVKQTHSIGGNTYISFDDKKGGEPHTWLPKLRIRQLPR